MASGTKKGRIPALGEGAVVTDAVPMYTMSVSLNEAEMSKNAVFTMKLEPDLRAAFMAEAEASHRPASQVVRELMRDFVQQQQELREHTAFVQRKVDVARKSVRDGEGRANADVEAAFAARRAQITDKE
jgi:predicted transcriptional regulator